MNTLPIDLIAEKLTKKVGSIITLDELKKLLGSCFDGEITANKIYKLTHQLKNRGHLISIKKDLLYIKRTDIDADLDLIEEENYWRILKNHCDKSTANSRYIGELTALEFILNASSTPIPEEIIVFNPQKQAIEIVIFNKTVNFKTYSSRGKKLFPNFQKTTQKIRLKNLTLPIASLELAVLECLYSPSITQKAYIETLILRAIKLNGKTLNFKFIEAILRTGKHNSSANRLFYLLQKPFPELSKQLEIIIKKFGTKT